MSEIRIMQRADKPRVVIDTNLIISAMIVAGSLPDKILRTWQKDLFTLLISDNIVAEVKEVLLREKIRDKYHISSEKTTQLITAFRFSAESVNPFPETDLPIHCRDAKDDKLLALAFGGEADYLVTGDDDLLVLNADPNLKKFRIINARDFLNLM